MGPDIVAPYFVAGDAVAEVHPCCATVCPDSRRLAAGRGAAQLDDVAGLARGSIDTTQRGQNRVDDPETVSVRRDVARREPPSLPVVGDVGMGRLSLRSVPLMPFFVGRIERDVICHHQVGP
jgi:hypothetical protein